MAVNQNFYEASGLILDCNDCVMQGTDACSDCVVAYVLERDEGAVVFDVAEERALRSLAQAGLVPDVRYQSKTG